MPIIEQQSGVKDGQPIMKPIYLCDRCGCYATNISITNGKVSIGCIRTKDGQVGCKENSK